jgi:hypothetical protein
MEESNEPIKEYVVNSLAKMTDRDDVIREVCLRENIHWDDGEALVCQIESQNKLELEKRKSPLLMAASGIFTIVGFAWALYSFYGLVFPIYVIWEEHGGLAHGFLWGYDFWRLFPQLLMSTGMAVSGILGLVHAFRGLREEKSDEDQ